MRDHAALITRYLFVISLVASLFLPAPAGAGEAPADAAWAADAPSAPEGAGLPRFTGEPWAVRVDGVDGGLLDGLEAEGFDIAFRGDGYAELLVTPEELGRLIELGLDWEPLGRDLFPGGRSELREGNLDPQYHTYLEMLAELQGLAADYPEICTLYDIGDAESRHWTWTNYNHVYDVWAVRISDNPDQDEPEPCIVYDGRHHAREPVTTEITLEVARFWCENYGSLPAVTDIVNGTEIWCVPMVNPDGHQWVEDVDVWWRKTLWDHDQDHLVEDSEGVDPNRNYDWHWSPGTWSSETYGGTSPWSAYEVAAMRDLHLQHHPAINASYHSYGREVLYPFGYGVDPEPAVIEITGDYASQIGYSLRQSTTANGSSKDWVYGRLGGVAFTVETATSFIPSGTAMLAEVAQILDGSLWLASRLLGSSIQGVVVDSVMGVPLAATIHIPEIHDVYGNGELYDMETETTTGFFCRMSPDAVNSYTLQVSAEGYLPKTVPVVTGGGSPTVVTIELVPESIDRGVLAGTITNQTGGGTPLVGAAIEVLPGGPTFESGPDGGYLGYVDAGTYTVRVTHDGFAADSAFSVPILVGETTVRDFALVDIAAPEISGTTHQPSTSDPVGPYPIETTIRDASGLTSVLLRYQVDGGGYQDLTLQPLGLDLYEAEIPGQPYGSLVEYYVYAQDPGGNDATDPSGAPGVVYTFFVAPEVVVLEEACEGGSPGWSHGAVTGGFGDQWHLSTARNHTAGGTQSWKCGDTAAGTYANLLDAALTTPAFTLSAGGELTFWHWIDAEESASYPGQAYDGGLLEVSVEGGPWEQLTPEGGYSHICRAGGTPGPFPAGTPFFSGSHEWEEVTVDLDAYAGEVQLRFRFGSDGSGAGEGWYVDDVRVTGLALASDVMPGDEIAARGSRLALRCAPNPLAAAVGTTVHFQLRTPSPIELQVIDPSGRVVRRLHERRAPTTGALHWDGRDGQGRRVGSGVYLMRLVAPDGAASEKLIVLE